MMQTDDETLMALVDGEITGPQADRLHAQIAEDAALAARFAMFARTATLVRQAALEAPGSDVPDEIVARIRSMGLASPEPEPDRPDAPNIVSLRRRSISQWRPMALAASLALAVGLGTGLFLSRTSPGPDGPMLSAAMIAPLDSVPSGEVVKLEDGRSMTVIASFTDASGAFCREYEAVTLEQGGYVAVACREDEDWNLRFAVALAGHSVGYTPASSLEVLDAALAAMGAQEPMQTEEELDHLR